MGEPCERYKGLQRCTHVTCTAASTLLFVGEPGTEKRDSAGEAFAEQLVSSRIGLGHRNLQHAENKGPAKGPTHVENRKRCSIYVRGRLGLPFQRHASGCGDILSLPAAKTRCQSMNARVLEVMISAELRT